MGLYVQGWEQFWWPYLKVIFTQGTFEADVSCSELRASRSRRDEEGCTLGSSWGSGLNSSLDPFKNMDGVEGPALGRR
jgi:hypothetical protein